jgi:tryptophan synthase beta chain
LPDDQGMFGEFGGRFAPPPLVPILEELTATYLELKQSSKFTAELEELYKTCANRPSSLYLAKRLTAHVGGANIYLKREDLNHTGAHKINNTLGQALVAKHLGKKRLIAETGAGQHGVATATVAALFGMECHVYMGSRDVKNQRMNVERMKLLGAKVIFVDQGQATLKDAVDAALVAFVKDPEAYYLLGSAVGPHPYPLMVRDFQAVIGREVREQMKQAVGKLPDVLVACVGGGSNALGLMYDFIEDPAVRLVAVEPAGKGEQSGRHGLALQKGKLGMIHGFKCLVLQDEKGEIKESYSAASGLDYPGVSPEFSYLKQAGRVEAVGVTDKQAVKAFELLSRTEGIIPALESAHAIEAGMKIAGSLGSNQTVVINLSGRGDKDVANVCENLL